MTPEVPRPRRSTAGCHGGSPAHTASVAGILHRIGWIGLAAFPGFLLFAAGNDLRADADTGIPVDHAGAFSNLDGRPFDAVQHATPGLARFVTTLEAGYALHELTFVLLFLALVLIPLRRRQPWAWWACWAVMIANLGYTFTLAADDSTLKGRSIVVDVAVPVLLLLCAPAIFTRSGASRSRRATP